MLVIKTYKCKETKKIASGKVSTKLPRDIQDRAILKIRSVNAAAALNDLKVPPSNHLEKLTGNRLGQHSIRINKQWRLCFVWLKGHSFDVEIADYH